MSALRLIIDTTKPGSANDTFNLRLRSSLSYNFTIDWGAGSPEVVTEATLGFPNISHTYGAPGVYTIEITENVLNGFPAIEFNYEDDRQKLMEISQWGDSVHWTTFAEAFYGCTNLVITATDEVDAHTESISSFNNAFRNCSSLTSFPLLNCSGVTDMQSTWDGCTNLSSFPLLVMPLCNNLFSAWKDCTSLASFPLIDVSSVTQFTSAWSACTGLTTFPQLVTTSAEVIVGAWEYCSNLTEFPVLDLTNCTSAGGAWRDCSSLTSFPLLDFSQVLSLENTWNGCYGLTSFPAINTSASTKFIRTWKNCTGLNGYDFPLLDLKNVTVEQYQPGATECFNGVTLSTSSYSALLNDMSASLSSSVTFDGGGSMYNASAVAARGTLATSLGWNITDGGLLAEVAPIIDTQPSPSSVVVGGSVSFSIVAHGIPNTLSYSWTRNGEPINDGGRYSGSATDTLIITGVTVGDAGLYVVTVSNGVNPNTISDATSILTVTQPPRIHRNKHRFLPSCKRSDLIKCRLIPGSIIMK